MQLCKVQLANGQVRIGAVSEGHVRFLDLEDYVGMQSLSDILFSDDPATVAHGLLDDNSRNVPLGDVIVLPPVDRQEIWAAGVTYKRSQEARGLSEKILLVTCGEIGRTPKINGKGGRDHWGNLAPLLLTGGGLKMGQVIGHSNKDAGMPQSDPVGIRNVIATVLNTLFDTGELRLAPGVPREVAQTMTGWEPIPGLL